MWSDNVFATQFHPKKAKKSASDYSKTSLPSPASPGEIQFEITIVVVSGQELLGETPTNHSRLSRQHLGGYL